MKNPINITGHPVGEYYPRFTLAEAGVIRDGALEKALQLLDVF